MAMQEDALTGPADLSAMVLDEDGTTVVEIEGEIDISTVGALREVLMLPEILNAPSTRVDLTRVGFLDSTGMSLLVATCKRVRDSGGSFSVVCGQDMVRRVLEISGLIDHLQVEAFRRVE